MCCWYRFLQKADIRRLKETGLCESCPNPDNITAHLPVLQWPDCHQALRWNNKAKHKTSNSIFLYGHTYPLEISEWEAFSCHSHDPSAWKQHKEVRGGICSLYRYCIYIMRLSRRSHLGQCIKHLEHMSRRRSDIMRQWNPNCVTHCSVASFQNISDQQKLYRGLCCQENVKVPEQQQRLNTRGAGHAPTSLKINNKVSGKLTF